MSIRDNSDQVSVQQPILTKIIISLRWLIMANPGVKDFAQTGDRTPVSKFSASCHVPIWPTTTTYKVGKQCLNNIHQCMRK